MTVIMWNDAVITASYNDVHRVYNNMQISWNNASVYGILWTACICKHNNNVQLYNIPTLCSTRHCCNFRRKDQRTIKLLSLAVGMNGWNNLIFLGNWFHNTNIWKISRGNTRMLIAESNIIVILVYLLRLENWKK